MKHIPNTIQFCFNTARSPQYIHEISILPRLDGEVVCHICAQSPIGVPSSSLPFGVRCLDILNRVIKSPECKKMIYHICLKLLYCTLANAWKKHLQIILNDNFGYDVLCIFYNIALGWKLIVSIGWGNGLWPLLLTWFNFNPSMDK